MVTRINGSVRQGIFFSKDIRIVRVNVGTGTATFLADLVLESDLAVSGTGEGRGVTQRLAAVGSELEQVVELIATRGTPIGVNVFDATNVDIMVDYAQAFDDAAVLAALEDEMDDTENQIGDWTVVTVSALAGFTGRALGTAT